MKNRKVISPKNLPSRLPIVLTFMLYIILDKFNAPQWLWGGLGSIIVALWILIIIARYHEEEVDLLNKD
jgi:hypothetical protein